MPHPVIAETNATLDRLRQATLARAAEESGHLSPNVYLCWDKAQGAAQVMVDSAPGRLLTADITVSGAPGWFTLNIGLGFGGFRAGDCFGLALAASTSQPLRLHPFVRSVAGDQRHDTYLTDAMHLGPSAAPQIVLHRIQPQDPLAWAGDFHTLIIPLPKQSFRLELQDMRAFYIARPADAPVPDLTLAALAI